MAEVRAGVDAVDRALVALLARRFGYMDAAARIKPERGHVRDEARKAQVIANAVRMHGQQACPRPRSPISGTGWSRPRLPMSLKRSIGAERWQNAGAPRTRDRARAAPAALSSRAAECGPFAWCGIRARK
jgi:isochorismate pyruvate lyase